MKIMQDYRIDGDPIFINGIELKNMFIEDLRDIVDTIMKVEYTRAYMSDLLPYSLYLEEISSYYCDQCGTTCSDYVGYLGDVKIEYSTHCFGDDFNYYGEDSKVLELIKGKFSPMELIELFHRYGKYNEKCLKKDYDEYWFED